MKTPNNIVILETVMVKCNARVDGSSLQLSTFVNVPYHLGTRDTLEVLGNKIFLAC